MITREEADALLDRMSGPEGAGLRDVARAPDLARTVVALYDERDAEVARGAHWRQAHDEADRLRDLAVAVADRAEQERDALARTVVALRADLDDKCSALTTAWDENARLALELRRLRAAEAPGTDDEAVAPWTCDLPGPVAAYWKHADPGRPGINLLVSKARQGRRGWVICGGPEGPGWGATVYPLALDAMRAAVPGSV